MIMAIIVIALLYLLSVTENKVISAGDKIERKQGDATPVVSRNQIKSNQTNETLDQKKPWMTPRMAGLISVLTVVLMIFLCPHIYNCCLMYF